MFLGGFADGIMASQNLENKKTANRLKKFQASKMLLETMGPDATYKDVAKASEKLFGGQNYFKDVYDEDAFDRIQTLKQKKQDHEMHQMEYQQNQWEEAKHNRWDKSIKRGFLNSDDPSKVKDVALSYIDEDEQDEFNEWYQNQDIKNRYNTYMQEESVAAADRMQKLGYTAENFKQSDVYKDLHPDVRTNVERQMQTRHNKEALQLTSQVETNIRSNALSDPVMVDGIAEGDIGAVESRIRGLIPKNAQRFYGEQEISNLANSLVKNNRKQAQQQSALKTAQDSSGLAKNLFAAGKTAEDVQSMNIPDSLKEETAQRLTAMQEDKRDVSMRQISEKIMSQQNAGTLVAMGDDDGLREVVRSQLEAEHPDMADDAMVDRVTQDIKQRLDPQITSAARVQAAQNFEKQTTQSIKSSRELETNKAATQVSSDVPSFYDGDTSQAVNDLGDDEAAQMNANVKTAYLTTVNTTMLDADEAAELYRLAANHFAQNDQIPSQGELQAKVSQLAGQSGLGSKLHMTPDEAAQMAKEKWAEDHLVEDDTTVILNQVRSEVGKTSQNIDQYDDDIKDLAKTDPKDETIRIMREAMYEDAYQLKERKRKLVNVLSQPQMFQNYDKNKIRQQLETINAEIERITKYGNNNNLSEKIAEAYERNKPKPEEYNPDTSTYDTLDPTDGGGQSQTTPRSQQPQETRGPTWGPGSGMNNNTERLDRIREGLTKPGDRLQWGPQ